jgi:hypothetical protein
MAIRFSCTCGTEMQADERYAGSTVQCPRCRTALVVPVAFAPPPAPIDQESGFAQPAPRRNGKNVKKVQQSNQTIWLAMTAGALAVVAVIAVARMFLSWQATAPEADPPAKQVARDARPAALPAAATADRDLPPGEQHPMPARTRTPPTRGPSDQRADATVATSAPRTARGDASPPTTNISAPGWSPRSNVWIMW